MASLQTLKEEIKEAIVNRKSLEILRETYLKRLINEQNILVSGELIGEIYAEDLSDDEVKVNVGNSNLKKMRLEKGLTQRQLAEEASKYLTSGSFYSADISNYERYRIAPLHKANALADYFNVDVEILFPEWISQIKKPQQLSKTRYASLTSCLDERRQEMLEESSPEKQFEMQELKQNIEHILETIPEQEANILRMYYGINSKKLTLREIAQKFGVTKERIRQIRERGLKHLKSIPEAKCLESYLTA